MRDMYSKPNSSLACCLELHACIGHLFHLPNPCPLFCSIIGCSLVSSDSGSGYRTLAMKKLTSDHKTNRSHCGDTAQPHQHTHCHNSWMDSAKFKNFAVGNSVFYNCKETSSAEDGSNIDRHKPTSPPHNPVSAQLKWHGSCIPVPIISAKLRCLCTLLACKSTIAVT